MPSSPVRLEIETQDEVPVVSKDVYVPGTVDVGGSEYSMQIKGRGNSTWGWPKKPYRIKLDSAASLLAMPSERDWVLLANYADRSAMRNHLALRLGEQTRMGWSPRTRYVRVILNDEPMGLYLLTEQVERSAARAPTDRWLLEVDERYAKNGDPGFRSAQGIPIAFKDPDDLTAEEQQQVKDAVAEFESVLYGSNFADPVNGYAKYVDVATFVDWYLVNELFKNVDSDFFSSVMVTWTVGERFAMGPPWDFDLSAGFDSRVGETVKDPWGWWTRPGGEASKHPSHNNHWIARMFQDPAFLSRVRARWAELRPTIDSMIAQIPSVFDPIERAALRDWNLWHADGGGLVGSVHAKSFTREVAFLQEWLTTRAAWISSEKAWTPPQQPDATIREARTWPAIGNNIYNVTGQRQTKTVSARRGRTRTFYVRVYNDGNARSRFLLRGSVARPGSQVTYFSGASDITRAMRSTAGYAISRAPGATKLITVQVRVLRGAAVGSTKPARVRAISTGGGGDRVDVVKGAVRVVR